MGKHSAPSGARDRRDARRVRLPRSAVVLSLAAVLAWAILVWFAIQLGPEARTGDAGAMILLVTATLGAMACLFLGLLQGTRLWNALRGDESTLEPVPPRPVGGRRARR